MRERILTALVLLPLVLGALYFLSGETVAVLLAVVILYCAWEWSSFVAPASMPGRLLFVFVVGDLIALLFLFAGDELRFPGMLEGAVAGWSLMLIWIARYPTPLPWPVALVLGVPILVIAWASLSLLALAGWQWLLFMLVLVWAADVGAFFAGRHFGVRKLAPRVSPGKTWVGVGGGLLLAVSVSVAGAFWFGQPLPAFVLLCAVSALLSVVGDLTVSMFKRSSNMKDSGTLLPGHGGALDRVDSLLAASPVFALGLSHLGIVQ